VLIVIIGWEFGEGLLTSRLIAESVVGQELPTQAACPHGEQASAAGQLPFPETEVRVLDSHAQREAEQKAEADDQEKGRCRHGHVGRYDRDADREQRYSPLSAASGNVNRRPAPRSAHLVGSSVVPTR
jgi:uncharacterized protein involved in copper resistance